MISPKAKRLMADNKIINSKMNKHFAMDRTAFIHVKYS